MPANWSGQLKPLRERLAELIQESEKEAEKTKRALQALETVPGLEELLELYRQG